MSNKKYCESVSVNWGNVLGLYRNKIRCLISEADRFINYYNKDLLHNFPDFSVYDRAQAVRVAGELLSLLDELNSLRCFLRYKPLSFSELKCDSVIDFYELNKDLVQPSDLQYPNNSEYYYR